MAIEKKVVLVTGASSGIGRETALLLSENKAYVILTYSKNKKGGEEAIKKCKNKESCFLVKLDICKDNSIKKAVEKIIKKYGKLDVLINNAGILYLKPFENQTIKELESQIKTNLIGTIKNTKYFLPLIKKSNNGLILNIASLKGKKGFKDRTAYCASKFGIRGFTQSLALELPKKIKTYAINPNPTATKMNKFKGDNPKRAAEVILKVVLGEINKKSGSDIDVKDY